jgi:hypothetical protein
MTKTATESLAVMVFKKSTGETFRQLSLAGLVLPESSVGAFKSRD